MSTFTLYTPRDSTLHAWHPLTTLTLVLCCAAAGVALPGIWPNFALFALVVLPLAAWGKLAGALLRGTWRIYWPFALSLLVIQGLFWSEGPVLAALGPLSLKTDGVLFALAMSGRILVLISSFLLLSLSTRPDALMNALTQRGFPHQLAYIVLSAIQIVPRFQAKAQTIIEAQQSRGLETEGRIWQRARALLPLIAPLLLSSLVDVEERAIALEARGFGRTNHRTSFMILTDTPRQRALRWTAVALVALLIAGRIGWSLLR